MVFKMAQNCKITENFTNNEDNNIIYCTDQISLSISFTAIRARVRVRIRVNPNNPNPNNRKRNRRTSGLYCHWLF